MRKSVMESSAQRVIVVMLSKTAVRVVEGLTVGATDARDSI